MPVGVVITIPTIAGHIGILSTLEEWDTSKSISTDKRDGLCSPVTGTLGVVVVSAVAFGSAVPVVSVPVASPVLVASTVTGGTLVLGTLVLVSSPPQAASTMAAITSNDKTKLNFLILTYSFQYE
ncbi:MAG: hypothetical protein ABI621_19505 [Chloroflexota bacterium]